MRIKNEGVEKRCRCRKGVIRPFYFLHLLSIFYAFAATAAIPLTWQVDTTRVAPVTFDAYHGETLALEAVFKDASRPLDLTGKTARLYWQTNGMENVYWATNATVSATNHIAATFTGAMDPGAASVRGFLGIAGENYRASFVIRFRPSPGFDPATLPLPTRTLDFATTEVRNAPYWTKAESDARYSGGGGGVSTNAVSGIITNHVTSGYLCTVAEARQMTNATMAAANAKYLPLSGNLFDFTSHYGVPFIEPSAGNRLEFGVKNSGVSSPLTIDGTDVLTEGRIKSTFPIITNAYTKAEADAAYYPKYSGNQIADSVATIAAHLNAEDARFVVTNYDSATRTPEAYVEIKVSNDWLRVWSEARRWNALETWKTNVTTQLGNKAERAWGIYDSETGGYSPDGYTQISSSNILIASGMAYQRTVTPFNSLWVLQCNQGTAQLGGDTNGYFRIKDGDGNTQFEIVKGNHIELGADASGITVDTVISTSLITIPYSVVANEHPTLQVCTDLSAGNWIAEGEAGCPATVSWTGTSGAYVAHVTAPNNLSQMFFKATYLGGSDTIINNNAPVKMQYIYIGNSKYAIGYATINGTGVMTLTPAN